MSVEQNLEQILSARYGKDVRQSIHDAIYDINEVAKDAEYHASTAPTSAQAYANAALAAEQAAQQAKQDAEAAAEQAMSGTPTGYDQVVAEVRSLKTSEDVVLAEAGTFVGRVLLDKMYGMTIQNGIPTPSVPVAINSAKANFENHGKNFLSINRSGSITVSDIEYTFNDDGSILINGTSSAWGFQNLNYEENKMMIPSGTYILSGGATGVNISIRSGTGSSYTNRYSGSFVNDVQVTIPSTDTISYARLEISTNKEINNATIKPMLRLVDDSDSTFEKYKGQSVITDLMLRAIEVTSSDAYNLVKDGKYYVADTLEKIDGGYQITRRCASVDMGTLTWQALGATSNYDRYVTSNLDNIIKNRSSALCEKFPYRPASQGYIANTISVTAPSNALSAFTEVGAYNSASAFKTGMSDTELIYQLATPTVETVSNANAKKLLSLKSYDEATYVAQTEDTEGVIVLKYGSTELSNMAVTGYVEGEQNSIRLSDLESAV